MMGIVGLGYAMMNGIPLKLGTINNGGYNVLDFRRSQEAKKSFWVQMKVAEELIDRILHTETGIIGLHRNLLICDRIYLALIGGEDDSIIDAYYTKDQKKYMKQMKNYPSVLRTEYAYALLYKKDRKEAEKIRDTFDKITKKYPYSADVESEKELMDIGLERV